MRLSDLDGIPLDELPDFQQVALLRLQLVLTGMTHRMFAEYGATVRSMLVRAAEGDGAEIAPEKVGAIATEAGALWRSTFRRWAEVMQAARRESVVIPLGSLVRMHNAAAGRVAGGEGRTDEALEVTTALDPAFQGPLQEVLDASANRVYGDGFNLSGRIWNLEQRSLGGIQATLQQGVAAGTSAFDLARELEQSLGADQNCTRWTSTRLYSLAPAERINSERGLLRGSPCSSQGVAYNALRMARNEIQIAHHEATRTLYRRQPWVRGEFIRLSPDHPERDICDEYAEGGPYAIGEVPLPIHVQCMCYSVADMPKPDELTAQLRDWMQGAGEPWPEMDAYHAELRRDPHDRRFEPLGGVLGEGMMRWLTGGIDEMEQTLYRVTDDVIWWVAERVL